jgi:hypothetical protein
MEEEVKLYFSSLSVLSVMWGDLYLYPPMTVISFIFVVLTKLVPDVTSMWSATSSKL